MVKFAGRKEAELLPARANTTTSLFAWPVRVFYEDTDAGGIVYYANYLRFMERARTEWLRELGFEHASCKRDHGAMFVVRTVDVKYVKPAQLDDQLAVLAVPLRSTAYQIFLQQDVLRGPETLVRAQVSIACIDSASFKPKTLPAALLAKLDPHE